MESVGGFFIINKKFSENDLNLINKTERDLEKLIGSVFKEKNPDLRTQECFVLLNLLTNISKEKDINLSDKSVSVIKKSVIEINSYLSKSKDIKKDDVNIFNLVDKFHIALGKIENICKCLSIVSGKNIDFLPSKIRVGKNEISKLKNVVKVENFVDSKKSTKNVDYKNILDISKFFASELKISFVSVPLNILSTILSISTTSNNILGFGKNLLNFHVNKEFAVLRKFCIQLTDQMIQVYLQKHSNELQENEDVVMLKNIKKEILESKTPEELKNQIIKLINCQKKNNILKNTDDIVNVSKKCVFLIEKIKKINEECDKMSEKVGLFGSFLSNEILKINMKLNSMKTKIDKKEFVKLEISSRIFINSLEDEFDNCLVYLDKIENIQEKKSHDYTELQKEIDEFISVEKKETILKEIQEIFAGF